MTNAPSAAQKRRARKEAATLAAAARRSMERRGARIPAGPRAELAAAAEAVDAAVAARDHDRTCETMAALDDLCERHLPPPRRSAFRETTGSIGFAVLVALLLRASVVEAFKIPTGSMIPTMEIGDHIFVNKFLYGLHIPFTKVRLFDVHPPERGDVIVFIYPEDPDKDFIKRVVAVAGDRVEVRRDGVHVNGQVVPHHALPGEWRYWDYDEVSDTWRQRVSRREEEQLGGHTYLTLHDPLRDDDFGDYPGPGGCRAGMAPDPGGDGCVVLPGGLFVMGDNRDNSHDSRYWGAVPLENVRGKAMVVWWSSGGPAGVRWNRMGHLLE